MMVPTRAMGVTVGYFFRGRGAHLNHFDIKGQGSAGHRMIGVDIGKFMANLGNNHMARAMFGPYLRNLSLKHT